MPHCVKPVVARSRKYLGAVTGIASLEKRQMAGIKRLVLLTKHGLSIQLTQGRKYEKYNMYN
jgi:hypothetical protein